MTTKIQWTDDVWNWLVGCSRISSGCQKCYASEAAKSSRLQQFEQYQAVKDWDGNVVFVEGQLGKPLKRRKPTRYFTCSMSDVFHESVPFEWIDKAFVVMAMCPQHTFQVLTKRPERMLEYCNGYSRERLYKAAQAVVELTQAKMYPDFPSDVSVFPNVLLGTTIENKKVYESRSQALYRLHNRGWTTFYSCEPLLEEVDLYLRHRPANWVIAGGESGSGARECHIDWIRSLVQQCQSANVPVFVKQLGSNPTGLLRDGVFPRNEGDKTRWKLRDRKGGDIEEWPEDVQIREMPTAKTSAISEVEA
jgi:protein gp37